MAWEAVYQRVAPAGFARYRAPLFIGVPVVGLDDAIKFRLHSADSDYVSEQELSHMDASYCYRRAAKRVHGHRTRTAPRRNLARL